MGTRIGQDSLREINRFNGTLSIGHFTMNAKDDIWVFVMVHRDTMTAEELAIWLETVGTVTNVANLVI